MVVARRLMTYIDRHIGLTVLAVLTTIAANTAALYIPYFSGRAIDAIGEAGQVQFEKVIVLCGWMIACIVFNSVLAYVTQRLLIRISSRITAEMRKEVFEHLLEMPVQFFDTHPVGDIISRISYDIDTINASLSSDIVTIATSVITVVGSFIMMLRISLILSLIFVITTPLIFFITRHRAKVVRPLFSKRSHKLGELNGFVEEMLSGHKTIKAYGQEETIVGRFDEKNLEAVDSYYEADYQGSIVGPTVNFINNLSLAMISGLGGALYLMKQISIGNISSFILYSRRFSGPISGAAEVLAEIQSAFSAARRVFALLDEPAEKKDDEDAIVLDQVEGRVAFENVRFSYVPEKEIIHGLDLHAEPGRMIAIVGPTGAGKTTIINMLMRFYDPDSGVIRVDGHDILHCTRDSLRKQFSMVLQDTWLFHGTIMDNIRYGCPEATDEQVLEAARAAQVDQFVHSLPDGYQMMINEESNNLSQGQKQLITIARAILSDPKILILDEATSSVDTMTEILIQRAMDHLMEGRTSFVIAHRLSTVRNADRIFVLQDGNIVEQGSHDELMEKKGFYESLYNSQFVEASV